MKVLFLALVLATVPAMACDINGKTGFLPENDLNISVGDKNANEMTEERFNEIIDIAEKFYEPIVKEAGGRLKIKRKWNSGTVNASAQRFFGSWIVNMYGGLARHEHVTDDGFALVVCHELGHHLGGAPHSRAWASNEGQSDYWGAMKCFRRIFEGDNNQEIISKMNVPEIVKTKCEANFTTSNEVALCIRNSMAGKSLAKLLGSLRNNPNVEFETPDTNVVSRTNNAHPDAQCRLDTYFAGALCDKRISDTVSDSDTTKGLCNRFEGYTDGVRPLCWFKPERM
jgi:hypothetical protein